MGNQTGVEDLADSLRTGFIREGGIFKSDASYMKLTIVVKASIVVSLISTVSSVLLSGLKNCYLKTGLTPVNRNLWARTLEVFSAFPTIRLPLNHLEGDI